MKELPQPEVEPANRPITVGEMEWLAVIRMALAFQAGRPNGAEGKAEGMELLDRMVVSVDEQIKDERSH